MRWLRNGSVNKACSPVPPDPKPKGAIRDPALLRALHLRWQHCALCLYTPGKKNRHWQRSLHHISKHPKDDLEENLVMLCGHGTDGCHGRIEAHDADVKRALAVYIYQRRPDTIAYLDERFPIEGADAWMTRVLGA